MAHFEKFSGGALGHMLGHYDRSKENIDNIDASRTHLNYNLAAADQPMRQLDFLHKRLSEVRVQNRKDVNKLCDWVVTAPKDLAEEELPSFFQETYRFLRDRYGKENVVSAYVHMDEVTPHIHFAFVPVVQDKKRGGWKLSAKEAVPRSDLRCFHTNLQKHLEAALGHPVHILNGATQEGNKSIAELKRLTALERLTAARNEAEGILTAAKNEAAEGAKKQAEAEEAVKRAEKEFIRLHRACNAKEKEQAALSARADEAAMYPEWAKVKKPVFFGEETVTVPKKEWERLHHRAETFSALQKLKSELDRQLVGDVTAERAYKELLEQLKAKDNRITELQAKNYGLKDQLKKFHARQQAVLRQLDPAASSRFQEAWEEMARPKQRYRKQEFELGG